VKTEELGEEDVIIAYVPFLLSRRAWLDIGSTASWDPVALERVLCVIPDRLVVLFLNGEQFINVATGVDIGISHGLESCTSGIGIIKMSYLGYNIVFVDTPGFDDTKRSDSDILKMISDWLATMYVVLERTKDTADR